MFDSRTHETIAPALQACRSLARSRGQSALTLAALAGIAASSPGAAVASGAVASLLLAMRPFARRGALGKDKDGAGGSGRFDMARDADGQAIALAGDAVRRGVLVTGGGREQRTLALLRLAEGALANASGFVFVDCAEGEGSERAVWDLARRYGREDDLLRLDLSEAGKARSNVLVPFFRGDRDQIVQTVVGLMDDAGGDGAMWMGRATSMFTGGVGGLCWLRDAKGRQFGFDELADSINLRRYMSLGDPAAHPEMPDDVRRSIRAYLTSLPGYNEDRGPRQAQTTLDQHGYLEMQFTKVLRPLADTYAVGGPGAGEIDLDDVVRGRRILYVRHSLGSHYAEAPRYVMLALKAALARSRADGQAAGTSPFLVLQDEAQDYLVPGLADVAAASRDAGVVYACQDIASVRRLSEREAASIIANTNVKIFMRVEEFEGATDDAPPMRRIDPEREAESIIASTNTKVFMRTEDMEAILGDGSAPGGIEGRMRGLKRGLAEPLPANRFLAAA